jgi:hypothetical protein
MELHLIINGEVEKNWQMQFHSRNFKWITSMDIHMDILILVVIQLMMNGVAFGAEWRKELLCNICL